jgi:hypothetical protein
LAKISANFGNARVHAPTGRLSPLVLVGPLQRRPTLRAFMKENSESFREHRLPWKPLLALRRATLRQSTFLPKGETTTFWLPRKHTAGPTGAALL